MTAKNKLINCGLETVISGAIVVAMAGEVLNKMFGTNEIPKGVVRELIEGVMDGLISHFQNQIDDIKAENEKLLNDKHNKEFEIEDLNIKIKELENKVAEKSKKKK